MQANNLPRQPHAVLDLPSRRHKGLKIEHLLRLPPHPEPVELLEIGTGSGGIAHYFAHHASGRYRVTAVDVVDQRLVRDGFDFMQVSGTTLPFAENRFDVVITNHVIEHVGDAAAQRHHLAEIRRVLRRDGVAYLAVPNRWSLVEPHYRLALLSWLPPKLRSPYLRLCRRGRHYDCNPPGPVQLEKMLAEAGFAFENLFRQALREFVAIEKGGGRLAAIAAALPDTLLDRLAPLSPTLIYRLRPV